MGVCLMVRRFLVVIEQDEDGIYIASVPSLQGCHTQAKTLAELEKRIQEAIKLYLHENADEAPLENKFIGVHQVEVLI